ncbi:MAG: glycosyltransferase, partial [Sedimentisphaerales bacterium]|nr:glycosyltransferase [Sedimentisphaerales bacterium]
MKIKVLHVIDHLGYGGAPFVVKNIAERIDSGRIETFVCALRTNPEAIPIQTTLINLGYYKYNPFVFFAIAGLCKKHGIDIVHAHLQKSILCCLLASFFCDAKIIVHEHGPIFRGGTGFLFRGLLKAFASRATMAIANSQAAQTALVRAGGFDEKSVTVVSNFINLAQLDRTLYDRNEARRRLGLADEHIVVGFVGRLDPCKGVDLLIEAAATLCQNDERYRFVIVGDGAQRNTLQNQATRLGLNEKIIFTGLCKNTAEVMIAFDMAVVPSRREAFGIAAVELMKMRIPVIASAIGGL